MNFDTLLDLLGGREFADTPCPTCGPTRSTPRKAFEKKLRIWRLNERCLSYFCVRCGVAGYSQADGFAPPPNAAEREAFRRKRAEAVARHEAEIRRKQVEAARIWGESGDAAGTLSDDYLRDRGILLPRDPEARARTLRFHPHCPFPYGAAGPALICGFTPIWTEAPDDLFFDPPPDAIHRIRGRGHENKAMLGPMRGKAVMISPWWHVHEHLHVAEGIETALRLYGEGNPGSDNICRPVWALGSAGGLEAMPVIERVWHLHIWADHDASGRGIEAAEICATRWREAGRRVSVRNRNEVGSDYGED
jgi:hypothetical protein